MPDLPLPSWEPRPRSHGRSACWGSAPLVLSCSNLGKGCSDSSTALTFPCVVRLIKSGNRISNCCPGDLKARRPQEILENLLQRDLLGVTVVPFLPICLRPPECLRSTSARNGIPTVPK